MVARTWVVKLTVEKVSMEHDQSEEAVISGVDSNVDDIHFTLFHSRRDSVARDAMSESVHICH